ncbi:MAG: hypothetical protein KBA82_09900 [Nitrosomonas sp.]|jgi:arginine decarboxylase|nr:hypothetical protein [Nitrosomonas sp.]MBP7113264.1 hypothetical protein [Nitrosomonas sp.]
MVASLDVARKQIVLEGYKLLSRTLELAKELRAQINSTGVFQVLELSELLPDEIKQDNNKRLSDNQTPNEVYWQYTTIHQAA